MRMRLSLLSLVGVFVACAGGESDDVALSNGPADAGGLDGGSGDESSTTSDAGRDAGPAATGSKRFFTTHDQRAGNFGGVDGADVYCEAAASAANLGGSWKAWISDSSQSASERIAKVGPWVLVDGTVVFPSASISGKPAHDLDMDELGETGIKGQVWTGTRPSGTSTGSNCGDWTTMGQDATVGLPHNTDKWADDSSGSPCNLHARLYCVEQ